jgi:hypothetical protein
MGYSPRSTWSSLVTGCFTVKFIIVMPHECHGIKAKRYALDKVKLLDQVRETIRLKHYSISHPGILRGVDPKFILFHGKRLPSEMNEGLADLTKPASCDTLRHSSRVGRASAALWTSLSLSPGGACSLRNVICALKPCKG